MYFRKSPKWKTLFSPRNILYQREDNNDAATIATVTAAHRRQRSRYNSISGGNIGSSSCSGCSCSSSSSKHIGYYSHSSDEEQPSEQFDYCTLPCRPPSHHHHYGSHCHYHQQHHRLRLKYYISGKQTIFAYMLHLVRLKYQRSFRLQWWYMLYPLLFVITAGATLLSFGTLYSHVMAHDPCQILAASTPSSSSSSAAALAAMPKLFHYQSKSSALSEETRSWRQLLEMEETESQVHPNIRSKDSGGWSSVYWSDESCAALVRDHFPSFWPVYMNYSHSIQRVDSCRYFILYKYGGIYADTDISFHSNATILERLVPHGVGLVESPYRYNELWQNSLMSGTVVQHPFWKTVLELMIERKNLDTVLSSTGPKMIGDAVQRWKKNNRLHGNVDDEGDNNYGDVHTLPCELFQRMPYGNWDTSLWNILGREVVSRAIPMRGCGVYGNGRCEITRHKGKASWANAGGTLV